jgi:hypothetical protein
LSVLSPKTKGALDLEEPITPLLNKDLEGDSEEEEEDDEYQNQYSLIFPSDRNTETYYQKFFDHS